MERQKAIEILNDFKNGKLEHDKLEIRLQGGFKIGDVYKFTELNPAIKTVLNELKQEKEKNKEMKKAIDYLQKIEPEKLKIIVDSWNEKVMNNLQKEWICKDKIKEVIEMVATNAYEQHELDYGDITDVITEVISHLKKNLLEEV